MKSKIFITLGVILCLAGTVIAAEGLEPGSADDPIVTKSYVDKKVSEVSANVFEAIEIKKGNTLVGQAGCEFILRAGEGSCISYFKDGIENGLQDITDGIDLTNGKKVPLNHLILIPRTDTRGFVADTDGFVMIKGAYEIK